MIGDLTAPRIAAFYSELLADGRRNGKGLAPKTVRNIHALLHRALKDAARWGYVPHNRADDVDPPHGASPERQVWSPEQLRAFLSHVRDDRLYARWILVATTGMRRAELAGLRWSNIDFSRARLTPRLPRVAVNYQVHESDPKTPSGRRSLALDPATLVWRGRPPGSPVRMLVQLALIVVLIAGNFFFVAAEFSITRIRPTEVAELEADRVGGARSLRHAIDHIDAYLSACQFGITLCSIGLGLAGEPAVAELLGPVLEPLGGFAGVGSAAISFAIAYALVSVLHVVVGELAPKSLAIARTRPTGLAFAPPMRLFYLATKPIVDLLNWLGNLVLRPFGIPPASEAGHAPHSEDELRQLVRHSRQEGMIAPAEHEFTDNVFTFGDRRAREAMVPGPEVELLTVDQSVAEAIDQVNGANRSHTRFPLCEADGGLDTALGIVHAKDLLGASGRDGEASLRDLARPLRRVPDGVLLDELLESLRRDRQHLALVVDEHDTAVGIITLEDVLEEIVGEIEDEFDPEADEVRGGEPRVPADGEETG